MNTTAASAQRTPPSHTRTITSFHAGWQQNFANEEHRVAVVDVHAGRTIDRSRPIKNNFVEVGFMTNIGPDGRAFRDADEAFKRIERRVLNQIRDIRVGRTITNAHRDAVADLFTIHLIRSDAFRESQMSILDQLEPDASDDYPNRAEVHERFLHTLGRPPYPGEVRRMVQAWFDRQRAGQVYFDSLTHTISTIRGLLRGCNLQIAETDDSMPGFIIGDVPVVHADLATRRFGFRDGLAVGDANLIMAPLSRRVAVFLTASPTTTTATIKTRKLQRQLNALSVRVARYEVACHPADGAEAQRVCNNPDWLPQGDTIAGR